MNSAMYGLPAGSGIGALVEPQSHVHSHIHNRSQGLGHRHRQRPTTSTSATAATDSEPPAHRSHPQLPAALAAEIQRFQKIQWLNRSSYPFYYAVISLTSIADLDCLLSRLIHAADTNRSFPIVVVSSSELSAAMHQAVSESMGGGTLRCMLWQLDASKQIPSPLPLRSENTDVVFLSADTVLAAWTAARTQTLPGLAALAYLRLLLKMTSHILFDGVEAAFETALPCFELAAESSSPGKFKIFLDPTGLQPPAACIPRLVSVHPFPSMQGVSPQPGGGAQIRHLAAEDHGTSFSSSFNAWQKRLVAIVHSLESLLAEIAGISLTGRGSVQSACIGGLVRQRYFEILSQSFLGADAAAAQFAAQAHAQLSQLLRTSFWLTRAELKHQCHEMRASWLEWSPAALAMPSPSSSSSSPPPPPSEHSRWMEVVEKVFVDVGLSLMEDIPLQTLFQEESILPVIERAFASAPAESSADGLEAEHAFLVLVPDPFVQQIALRKLPLLLPPAASPTHPTTVIQVQVLPFGLGEPRCADLRAQLRDKLSVLACGFCCSPRRMEMELRRILPDGPAVSIAVIDSGQYSASILDVADASKAPSSQSAASAAAAGRTAVEHSPENLAALERIHPSRRSRLLPVRSAVISDLRTDSAVNAALWEFAHAEPWKGRFLKTVDPQLLLRLFFYYRSSSDLSILTNPQLGQLSFRLASEPLAVDEFGKRHVDNIRHFSFSIVDGLLGRLSAEAWADPSAVQAHNDAVFKRTVRPSSSSSSSSNATAAATAAAAVTVDLLVQQSICLEIGRMISMRLRDLAMIAGFGEMLTLDPQATGRLVRQLESLATQQQQQQQQQQQLPRWLQQHLAERRQKPQSQGETSGEASAPVDALEGLIPELPSLVESSEQTGPPASNVLDFGEIEQRLSAGSERQWNLSAADDDDAAAAAAAGSVLRHVKLEEEPFHPPM